MKKLISGIVAVAMALSLAACEKETKGTGVLRQNRKTPVFL